MLEANSDLEETRIQQPGYIFYSYKSLVLGLVVSS